MIVIIDYGVGNLTSIQNMLKKAGYESIITGKKDDIIGSDKIILPGMGHFDHCMQQFNRSGLRNIVESIVFEKKVPVLGICVGLQMFMRSSEEGKEPGLGWIEGKTIGFRQESMDKEMKIPNMGWLDAWKQKNSKLLDGLFEPRFYFAHSFHIKPDDESDVLLSAEYGYPFAAAVEKGSIVGVQFHPEKSHRYGMLLLKNFAENY